MTAKERNLNPLDSFGRTQEWVDALLVLFWAVDAEISSGRQVNPAIATAFVQAETARQRL